MVRRFVPAKTDCGVAYLKPVGRPTRAQEDEHLRKMSGVVAFTSVDSRSQRIKGKKPVELTKKEQDTENDDSDT